MLDKIKETTKPKNSLVPREKLYKQYRNHHYYILKKHGITQANVITSHGLRHEHLNKLYHEITGHHSPVHGGTLHKVDKEKDKIGREIVSERAGHSREQIASAYLGDKS